MSGWLVGRVTRDDISVGSRRQAELAGWIRSLGVDPTNLALRAAVILDGDQHLLHLSEYVLDGDGRKILNAADNEIVTRLISVPVEPGSWPTWLAGPGTDPAPPYVHRLIDAFLDQKPLNFGGASVPADVQRRLTDARDAGTLGTVPA